MNTTVDSDRLTNRRRFHKSILEERKNSFDSLLIIIEGKRQMN